MRVLLLRRRASGGLAKYTDALAFALPKLGIELKIEDAASWIPDETGPGPDRQVSVKLKSMAESFDIVHACGYRTAWACGEGLGNKKPWVYSAYDLPKSTHPFLVDRLNKAKAGVCASYAIHTPLNEAGVQRLETIYPGIQPFNITNRADARTLFDLPPDEQVVACLGQFDTDAGYEALFPAMETVWAHHPKAEFLIAGSGRELENFRSRRWETSAPERVRVPGEVVRSQDVLAACDLFVVPERRAGFSLTAVEAMFIGLSVLARNAGALPEILHEHVSGLLFQGDTVLGEAIAGALEMPLTLEAMGNAAAIRAHEMFSLEQSAERIAELYRNVLN